ncbi:MAG: TetR/AcrR family transcriptional regulator [Parvibaculaceae bacterium]|nr:TetR/AcrR family transcriptional regulator [Parvibaculaceae bacterium]
MSRRLKSNSTTKEDILNAAWDLVSEYGADASIAQIAAAAGVSRQAIYLHFKTRGGLLIALVHQTDKNFGIMESLKKAHELDDPAMRLDATIAAWLEFVPKILPVAKDLIRLQSSDEDAKRAWDDRMKELKQWLKQTVASLRNDNALSPEWTINDASNYLWAEMSVQMWMMLVEECGWSPKMASTRIRKMLVRELISTHNLSDR